MHISAMTPADLKQALPFISKIIAAGDTYALDRDMDAKAIENYFFRDGNMAFKAEDEGQITGVYYLRPNQAGGGSHVANAGFMVSDSARGKGVARAMAAHALATAKDCGFAAIQFNFVVSINFRAVKLWQSLGFNIIGTIPEGFEHPEQGRVDVLIMHRFL